MNNTNAECYFLTYEDVELSELSREQFEQQCNNGTTLYDIYKEEINQRRSEAKKEIKSVENTKETKVRKLEDFKGFGALHDSKSEQHIQVKEGKEFGGYTTIPHDLYRKVFPELLKKYTGHREAEKVRAAFHLLLYLHSMSYGGGRDEKYDSRLFGWSWPKDEQIMRDTGIGKNQLKARKELLQSEGLLKIEKVRTKNGNVKDYYLPFYLPYDDYK